MVSFPPWNILRHARPARIHTYYRPRSGGDNALGSVRPSVSLSVCLSVCVSLCVHSHAWTVWPTTFIFCMEVDLDLGQDGYVGQGRRSRSYAKTAFYITVTLLWGQGQRSGSRSRVKVMGQGQLSGTQRSILGARLCRVQQSNRSHYQFKVFVCVSL